MFQRPMYEFAEIEGDDDLSDVVPVKPLPDGLLDPTRWDIPGVRRLSDLTEGRTNAYAFELWAREQLGVHERAVKVVAFDGAEEAGVVVNEMWFCEGSGAGGGEIMRLRREALKPFFESAMTLRQIADICFLPLSEIVAAAYGPQMRQKAEAYAELEERIIDGLLGRSSPTKVAVEYHTSHKLIADMADRHGIDRDAARVERRGPRAQRYARARAAAAGLGALSTSASVGQNVNASQQNVAA